MIGMVLAAGAGRRLRPYTETLPKALLPIDGETTILDIVLGNLVEVGLGDVVIVVGHRAGAVEERKTKLESRYDINITLVRNDKAEEWNNAYSMWLARDYFTEGVLMVNGDTVHPVSVEHTLLAGRGPDVLLAVDTVKLLADEEMKVILDGHGYLQRITKRMNPAQAYGEYIGVSLLEPAAAEPLADALQTTWEHDPNLFYEDGYQELINRGGKISVVPIGTVNWVEVDNHADLNKAHQIARGFGQ
ncbi:MAG: sugar phosphate nucleotidyltransferase [Pseudonocardiaceae bacterium]